MSELSDGEKDRIRSELRYVVACLEQLKQQRDPPPRKLDGILAVASNGFVLLILGALITSCLVPSFQKASAARAKRAAAIQDCLNQFHQYALSPYEEMTAVAPLAETSSIDKQEYDGYMKKLGEIRLKRYSSYAKLQSIAIAFRHDSDESDVEKQLRQYAVSVQQYSERIDDWVGELFCSNSPGGCVRHGDAHPMEPYAAFLDIRKAIHTLDPVENNVAAKIVDRLAQLGEIK